MICIDTFSGGGDRSVGNELVTGLVHLGNISIQKVDGCAWLQLAKSPCGQLALSRATLAVHSLARRSGETDGEINATLQTEK